MKPTYDVTTWDADKQAWTPQQGVRRGPWTKWGLRKALRKLRNLGYSARRGDAFVAVARRGMEGEGR